MSFTVYLILLCWACIFCFGLSSKKLAKPQKWIPSREPPPIRHPRPLVSPSSGTKPYKLPPLQEKTSSTHPGMGLKRLDAANWLTIDEHYISEHALRARFLKDVRPQVIQCLPGSEAACREVLDTVVIFLTSRFPQHFSFAPRRLPWSPQLIQNHLTGECYIIGSRCTNPLETTARLAMEDFNVLMKNPDTGDYSLIASATLFPAGWKLQDRIGTSMVNLHAPVPGWKEKLSAHVERYFTHLTSRTAMERTNLFIQTTPDLFQDCPESIPDSSPPLRAEQCMVRRERQTFSRLEKTGAVLFTVRSFMKPLTGLEKEEAKALLSQIRGWDESIRAYKGWEIWGRVVEDWYLGRLADDEGVEKIQA